MRYSCEIELLSYKMCNEPLMYIQYNLITIILETYYGMLKRKKNMQDI
jgi:hypothetical protein